MVGWVFPLGQAGYGTTVVYSSSMAYVVLVQPDGGISWWQGSPMMMRTTI